MRDSFVSLLTGHEKNLAGNIDNRLASALGFSSPTDYLHCRMPAAAARQRLRPLRSKPGCHGCYSASLRLPVCFCGGL